MAAYAAVVSLINTIGQIMNNPRVSTMFDQKQLESLLERVDSLVVSVESCNNSYGGSKDEAVELERQIASAAHSAEDVIESHIVYQILPEDMLQFPFLDIVALLNMQLGMLDLREVIQDMDSIREKAIQFEEERGCKVDLPPESSTPVADSSRQQITAGKSKMVGFDGYFTQLLDKLTGHQADRQIIPIVGMGGLGKTTLARNAYDSLPVVKHFVVRAWVVISQTWVVRDILSQTLSSLGKSTNGMDEHELGQLLHETLFNRRYLIVLDDMWSIEAWDRIKFYFPDNCNGSRILVTTRILDITNHFGSTGLELNVLDDGQSWNLFCESLFPHEGCPVELEESGKEIVRRCGGLPLAIVVIGGLLGSISRKRDQWERVEKDITSILNTANDNQCLKVLSLSYSHLPARLKPCFLYLGIFPEDDVIRVSRLVKLWVAEGFIKPNKDQSLEEIAEGYIKNLVDRNLISVHGVRWSGKVKTIFMHDLVRDLCIRVAEKEKFHHVTSQDMDRKRRVIIQGSTREEENYAIRVFEPRARSLISNKGRRQVHVKSRLLRVLVGFYCKPANNIFHQVNLRFLSHELGKSWSPPTFYPLPSSIFLLWNVQTLIIGDTMYGNYLESGIWRMSQLRHLKVSSTMLSEPPPSDDGIVLHNLQTLGRVVEFRISRKTCKRMPNIKKLHVLYSYFSRHSSNFALFNKLESLHYELGSKLQLGPENLLQSLKFPNSLKKLTLERFALQWKDLRVIGSLPHLEALIIDRSISGDNWDPVEGEFLRLRFLQIDDSDLIFWNANDTHFPILEKLVLNDLAHLIEIPSCIGDIQTLECISLFDSSISAAVSAVKIQEEQKELWNRELQVKVQFEYESSFEKFMEHVQLEGLTGANFHV